MNGVHDMGGMHGFGKSSLSPMSRCSTRSGKAVCSL